MKRTRLNLAKLPVSENLHYKKDKEKDKKETKKKKK